METKNLLSIDLTDDKSNALPDETPFTTAVLSPETRKRSEEATHAAFKVFMKGVKLPLLLTGYILVGLAFIVLMGLIKALPDVGLSTALRNGKWLILGGAVSGAVGGILLLIHKKSQNRPQEETAEEASANRTLESISRIVEMELGLPDDDRMTVLDLLPYEYKRKDDGTCKEVLKSGCYNNACLSLWREEETLCLTDYECVIRIPLSAFEGYVTEDEKFKINFWYKDEECTEAPYDAYGIKEDSDGNYRLSTYYRVFIRHEEERYEMRIPCYDFPAFRELVDLPCLDGTAESGAC